ncbi:MULTISPECIES: helix-turn-helix transcriptional regulator [Streptomyces]|uniref:Helix-turn-helix domain-containing protein n=1 Tax=Streptomyces thermoviolaceus subsp. thermoviolaceus TaxID=66860 RepID=A0ABX0YRL0_STRTL|nr:MULTISPECIES: helix-turn-helix transcriptional regulator [Streptomyces]MCM3264159.1 helix-turn-helix transcriptional regulator [Streptomyces thermoviolaceus]NJP13680.1 helix-turn-helix domain-containing protein [Streptomyces thermoviolaceus subsp. thermoviolaceus]RSS04147.1 XRE family transcriptional regulator [Streptomyces sp. WAC00469]WTD49313.1 helix-turn-helix transcriptional regulator [Streptomyces thermoviolaceus]GGV60411.1 DNA-binding protein [Streptomyces thermoviolaceus subsp. apin
MDRAELADFLRRSRARLAPSDVGLAAGARRRTPGLRREEVAQLAGMSVDYYTRLEQSRGPRPSRQMLSALARALRLTEDERDHLFHLTGEQPPRRETTSRHVRPGLLLVLDRLHDAPAMVATDCGEVLAQNAMSRVLSGDLMALPPCERNLIRRFFLDPRAQETFPAEDRPQRAREQVASLRAVTAARPEDPEPAALVTELRAASEEFARLWDEHEVAVRRASVKRFRHPLVGVLELDCEVLAHLEHTQQLVVHTARPGTDAHEKLQLLRVVGLQDLTAPVARTP